MDRELHIKINRFWERADFHFGPVPVRHSGLEFRKRSAIKVGCGNRLGQQGEHGKGEQHKTEDQYVKGGQNRHPQRRAGQRWSSRRGSVGAEFQELVVNTDT